MRCTNTFHDDFGDDYETFRDIFRVVHENSLFSSHVAKVEGSLLVSTLHGFIDFEN